MRFSLVFIFFFTLCSLAQNEPIKISIDSIISEDIHPKKRKFSINYSIENQTNHPVRFFLIPNTLIANAASSMTLFPIYRIYQNGVFQELDGPFYEKENPDLEAITNLKDYTTPEAQTLIKNYFDKKSAENKEIIANYKAKGGTVTDESWIIKNHQINQSIITLQPNEIKTFVIKTTWNKNRYYNEDDIEYYLDEKDDFTFELVLDLKKLFFREELSPENFSQIKDDPYFIQGVFTSNKMKIDFRE